MITRIMLFFRKHGISSRFLFIFSCLAISVATCFYVILIYSRSLSGNPNGAFATLFMTASAAYAIGNIFGFIFGIPKTIDNKNRQSKKPDVNYQVNTSLEQISDWLTKMILGAGLVELKDIKNLIIDISSKIASDIGVETSQSIIMSSIICFMILGFFVTYLSTRLYIANALVAATTELQEVSEENR